MNQPKKGLGQHWLRDQPTLEYICQTAEVAFGDSVLEVGPGLGTLTEKLLDMGAVVIAVEKDQDLIATLSQKFSRFSDESFKLYQADILQFDLGLLPKDYKVVANIPYYLTSNLIRRICEADNPFNTAALLIQKEVAERVCASPGDMSILAVATQFYCQAELGRVVEAELFTPPPKVDSQVIKLTYRKKPLFENVDEKKLFNLVRAGFSEKRKMLRSSLSGGLAISKTEAEELLTKAGINPELRAQALSLEDWHNLYKVY